MNELVKTRKKLKLTQEQTAKLLNVSRRSYQYYESGEIVPDIYDELIEKLSDYFTIDETHGFVSLKTIKDAVSEVADKYNFIHAVYLFGSYARKQAKPDSDIDLLIIDDPIGFDNALFYMDLKEILKKNIDVTSYRQVNDPDFLREILIDGIKIYG